MQRSSDRTWQRDKDLGANTLTISCGHTIDALRFVVGHFSHVSSVVGTQAKQWFEVDTNQMADVTSPDNILVSGRLANGGVASVHIASNPWAGSGYRMEIYGREATLVASSAESPNHDGMRLQGAPGGNQLDDLEIPEKYVYVLAGCQEVQLTTWGKCTTNLVNLFSGETTANPTSIKPSSRIASSTSSSSRRIGGMKWW